MKKLGIFALAAVCALAACKKDGDDVGGDSTAVGTDTAVVAPAPVAPVTPDTTMAPPVDSTAPTTDTAGSIPVRCTTGDPAAPDGVITANARHDPRLVCSELWRRGELVGGTRKSAPLTACARTDASEVLVLVTSDGGDSCRAPGSTSQQ